VAITTTQQLGLYNGALRLCGNTRLASLTDNQEARYLLDDAWNDGNGAPQACLEEGYWFFATRTSMLGYDATITPNFGYAYAFEKPTDWVRTCMVAQDEYFQIPLTQFTDEAGYFYTLLQTIYFSYISNAQDYGLNFLVWPQSFVEAVEGYLARKVVRKLCAGDEAKIDKVEKAAEKLMLKAKSKAAMNESAKFLPAGTWLRARWGAGQWGNGGNASSLYG
jgi:hypothetical protein